MSMSPITRRAYLITVNSALIPTVESAISKLPNKLMDILLHPLTMQFR